ncbi:hypothetical protein DX130_06505 [Paenibacillus paeoniae]|uniref:Uncharacterized protein n=2 Tax=Paenibacillus paeoniae TaxID=2292705 RepID=A0A371PKG7_9BACL|nr:hypothetical protein DX130_06505 [Paenibacillus paeoniae]
MLLLILVIGAGCAASNSLNDTVKIRPESVTINEDAFLADSMQYDLDGDGQMEMIRMYIYPAPAEAENKPGQYLWHESHQWQLIVNRGEDTYLLYNNHLSGKLKFWIEDRGGSQKAIVLLEEGKGLRLDSFTLNEDHIFERMMNYNQFNSVIVESSTTFK